MADSIRDALTQAFDKADVSDSTPPASAPVTLADAAPPDTGSTAPDTSGAAPSETPEDKTGTGQTVPETGQVPALGSPPQTTPAPAAAPDPAPASWKAEGKADWDKIPASAKAEIKRREADMQRAFSITTEGRKFHDNAQRTFDQFKPLLEKHNVTDPIREVVQPMLEFRAILDSGTPHQKALAVRNMVKGFGIDIDLLDQMLVDDTGKFEQPKAPVFDPRAVPELAPLFELAEARKAQQEAAVEQIVSSYDALPHAEVLREDTADIMSMWAKRGQAISIEDAHKRALAMHPELAPPAPPPAPPSVSEAAAILAKSRNAASTVSGAPRAGGGKPSNTLRDSILAAVETHSS